MLTIQDLGLQLLGDSPGKFYILGGAEYGIKERYITLLRERYGNQTESASVKDVIDMLSKKHIIPLQPSVYVIRYDETFLSEASDLFAQKLARLKFDGTIVCLYEHPKHINKLDKYFPNYTASIDAVSPQFVAKYLKQEFPKLPDRFINIAIEHGDNYTQSQNMCRCMSAISPEALYSMSDVHIASLFGCSDVSTEAQIRQGVASRKFNQLIDAIENYDDSIDRILYTILQTMIELDKLLDNTRTQSDIRPYVKYWTRQDVYYMFMNTYAELKKSRSSSGYDIHLSLIYLFGLLKFQRIPSPEVMNQ